MTKSQFEEIKPQLIEVFQKAIYEVLQDMGDDVKGISWFSSQAK
jgi:hypothetical protein